MILQSKSKEIWMYIGFPKLSLEAVTINASEKFISHPLVIVDTNKNRKKIIAYNNSAYKCGIDKSVSLSTALAICPHLNVNQKDPLQERNLLNSLAIISYQFTPNIAIENNGLYLEIFSCEKLFKSYENLLYMLYEKISHNGVLAVNGFGKNPLTAKMLCKNKFQQKIPNLNNTFDEFKNVSIKKLTNNLKHIRIFDQLGFQSIGDLINIPISSLSQRFDEDLISNLEVLLHQKKQLLTMFKPPKNFHEEILYIHGLTDKKSLIFPMKSLLKRLDDYLTALQYKCFQVAWHFKASSEQSVTMEIKLSKSKSDSNYILKLSQLKLENIDLPEIIEKVSLRCDELVEDIKANKELFKDAKNKLQNKHKLVDKIIAKIGEKALFKLLIKNEHAPKKAGIIENATEEHIFNQDKTENKRPIWLLKKPNPIKFQDGQLYLNSHMTILSGPERICDNWWENNQQFDYYIAQDEDGVNYWIYRSGNNWFVHGLFS